MTFVMLLLEALFIEKERPSVNETDEVKILLSSAAQTHRRPNHDYNASTSENSASQAVIYVLQKSTITPLLMSKF